MTHIFSNSPQCLVSCDSLLFNSPNILTTQGPVDVLLCSGVVYSRATTIIRHLPSNLSPDRYPSLPSTRCVNYVTLRTVRNRLSCCPSPLPELRGRPLSGSNLSLRWDQTEPISELSRLVWPLIESLIGRLWDGSLPISLTSYLLRRAIDDVTCLT